ncbi:ATP-binding protein [Pararhizobium antarcticum]|uniref:Histidine kinase n=1 Tax=Pararhizobium antarcticum TaxID=1798805 RepID=A0A657LVW4_9HYPH|nr:ATP-binding protein [Pararhizobium antarcticum]OJF99609.1 hypothetical protein AX760_12770 [Pararhizobium antarcticum]
MPHFQFSVDAALLRELGERLVGQPHIALAELIKNSYDADAIGVSVTFGTDTITVLDNGDGMTKETFRKFWMRVGSPHKQEVLQTTLGRRPTGSKGIGRLAVQFLGSNMTLRTTPSSDTTKEMIATVNWAEATKANELTQAKVEYHVRRRTAPYAGGQLHGTEITVSILNQIWEKPDLEGLARQIWQLRPPFQSDSPANFSVSLHHPDQALEEAFSLQLGRILDIWSARVRGKLLPRKKKDISRRRTFRLVLEFSGGEPESHEYEIPDCDIHKCSFEIRIFSLYNKQRYGVQVESARQYLKEYGGVHIYDAGFHLPYYGPDTDWLKTEIDHSHRKSTSMLLPEALQEQRGLNNLPTMSRVYGVVNVDTGLERNAAIKEKRSKLNEYLQIQASRDRLVSNPSYRALRDAVRYALDFYAVRQTVRMNPPPTSNVRLGEISSEKVRRVEEVIDSYRESMPAAVYHAISNEVKEAVKASETDAENAVKQIGLLGALATAGIAALAYEHEASKQLADLDQIVRRMKSGTSPDVRELAVSLENWIKRAKQTRALFAPINDRENRETRAQLRALPLLESIFSNVRPLLAGTKFLVSLPESPSEHFLILNIAFAA